MVDAQQYRERIDVDAPVTAADGQGGRTVTWQSAYASLPCRVQAVRGRETISLGRTVTVETYLVGVRYGASIGTTHRVTWGSKVMNVRSAQDRDGDRRELVLECEVGVGQEA